MNKAGHDHQASDSWIQWRASAILLLIAVTGITGCAPTSLYDWGNYEDSLYLRYTDHDFNQAESYLSQSLPTTAHPSRIPPGVYADYGFLLYRRGDYSGAIQFFEKEKQIFPESSALMTRLIDRVQQKIAQQDGSKTKDNPKETGGTAQ